MIAKARDRQSLQGMIGEFLREVAVLVFVFGLLDLALAGRLYERQFVLWVTSVSVVSLVFGIAVERTRKE